MATILNQVQAPNGRFFLRVQVEAGETTPWYFLPTADAAVSVAVRPGAGGSMIAYSTQSPPEVVQADNSGGTTNAISIPWPKSTVSAAASNQLYNSTAVRFQATTQPGIAEVTV